MMWKGSEPTKPHLQYWLDSRLLKLTLPGLRNRPISTRFWQCLPSHCLSKCGRPGPEEVPFGQAELWASGSVRGTVWISTQINNSLFLSLNMCFVGPMISIRGYPLEDDGGIGRQWAPEVSGWSLELQTQCRKCSQGDGKNLRRKPETYVRLAWPLLNLWRLHLRVMAWLSMRPDSPFPPSVIDKGQSK